MKPTQVLTVLALSMILSRLEAQTKYPHQNGNPYACSNGNVMMSWGSSGYHPYNNYHPSAYRKSAKYNIRSAGAIINDAVNFHSWNEMYSPILAKAIRHYHFARQLYMWHDYHAAINHAERAKYLAWYSLQFFHGPDCGENMYPAETYPDPYGDPYDPYYKKANPDAPRNVDKNQGEKNEPQKNELDRKLPGASANDQDVIRKFQRSDPEDE
jgi:hypothetical protein